MALKVSNKTKFDRAALKRAVDDFVSRVFSDFIIGFWFEGKDQAQIARHEFDYACGHLFGEGNYKGKPIVPSHQKLGINAGHFRRRLAILRKVLTEHGFDEDVIEKWLSHDQKLEQLITQGRLCTPSS